MRSEAKLAALKATLTVANGVNGEDPGADLQEDGTSSTAAVTATDHDNDVDPATREEGRELWNEFLTGRFVRGEDPDFDYSKVDNDDGLDAMERQDEQDAWFDEEDPAWVSGEEPGVKKPQGETGVQDF